MGLTAPEPTCEERYEQSICEAIEMAECLDSSCLQHFLRDFFAPEHAVDPGQFGEQVKQFLYCAKTDDKAGNNAEKICQCDDSGSDCCCSSSLQATGCDDPEQCLTSVAGYNFVVLARAAQFAFSLAYMPLKIRDPQAGDILTYDPDAAPDNKSCDPCKPTTYGAWVNIPAHEVLG